MAWIEGQESEPEPDPGCRGLTFPECRRLAGCGWEYSHCFADPTALSVDCICVDSMNYFDERSCEDAECLWDEADGTRDTSYAELTAPAAEPRAPAAGCGCTDSSDHFGSGDCVAAGCCWSEAGGCSDAE